jgi:hypothetical protein
MKKLTILFASAALALSLGAAGCKKKEAEKKADDKAMTTPTDPNAKPVDPAKPADPGTTTTTTTTTTTPPAPAGDLPAECGDYKAMIEKLASCDKMPQQSRDALKQGFDAMSQGWANVGSMPAEAKKAMADGCKQGTDALKNAAGAMCGW